MKGPVSVTQKVPSPEGKVFLVHGRNEAVRESVARFFEMVRGWRRHRLVMSAIARNPIPKIWVSRGASNQQDSRIADIEQPVS
jgi:hypothetical protein